MARLVAERADVIPALGETFRRYGFEGASIARISEQTKMGKGSLYHFFPGGKDEMAIAVLADIQDWFEKNIFAPLENDNPIAAISNMFAAVEAYFRSGQRICLMGAFALEETRDRFSDEVKLYFARWLEVLSQALNRAGFDDEEAAHNAKAIIAGIQGAIILCRALDHEGSFSDTIGHLKRLANTI